MRLRPHGTPAGGERRREVERRLAEHGLLAGPHRVGVGTPEGEAFAHRLRWALADLGGGFAVFGGYLASRADLLGVGGCLELAELAGPDDGSVPADAGEEAAATAAELIAAELGAPPPELFSGFEAEPFAVRALEQRHRAWLPDGRAVVVRLLRPSAVAAVEADLEHLALLRAAFPDRRDELAAAIADFRRELAERLDLRRRAALLRALGEVAADGSGIFGASPPPVPEVIGHLSGPKVLTLEQLGGVDPAEVARLHPERPEVAYSLARRLALLWLQQLFGSRGVPVELEAEELADGRLAITGGLYADAAGGSRENLREYLRAAAAHDAEAVAGPLLRELAPADDPRAEVDFRRRLRQAVPFRAGRLSADGESLAEHLLLHWRLAVEHGYRPRPQLLAFYRGVFRVAASHRALGATADAARDPLRDALGDRRWREEWSRIGELADPMRMAATFESYLSAFSTFPQQLERLLDDRERRPEPAPPRRSGSGGATAVALALAMAAVALLTHRLSGVAATAEWAEPAGTVIFLVLGALLLRAAGRR